MKAASIAARTTGSEMNECTATVGPLGSTPRPAIGRWRTSVPNGRSHDNEDIHKIPPVGDDSSHGTTRIVPLMWTSSAVREPQHDDPERTGFESVGAIIERLRG